MATLTERLAARATKTALEKGQGRSAFLALKPEIQAALKEGWNAKEVWSLLKDEGKIGVSYSVFLRYIREYIAGTAEDPPPLQPLVEGVGGSPEAGPAVSKESTQRRPTPSVSGQFNIESQPDKRNLV